jgi:hypothetical protein
MTDNYALSAFANEHTPFAEAVSDYLASDHSGNPLHAGESWNLEFASHDISNRTVQTSPTEAMKLNDVSQMLPAGHPAAGHDNSVFYSKVLWELRNTVGSDNARAVLKATIESSNQSWTAFRTRAEFKNASPHNRELQTLEFFLANLAAVGQETQNPGVPNVVAEAIAALKLDPRSIERHQSSLVRDGLSWAPSTADKLKAHAYVYTVAAAPLVVAGAAIAAPSPMLYVLTAEPEPPANDDEQESSEPAAQSSQPQSQ